MTTDRLMSVAGVLLLLLGIVAPDTALAKPRPQCFGATATIIGTDEDKVVKGTRGDDVIVNMGGAGTIDGRAGNDRICGSEVGEEIRGGPGGDKIDVGPDSRWDEVFGEGGNDLLLSTTRPGGAPAELTGGRGDDRLVGRGGNGKFSGGPGDDVLDSRHGYHWAIFSGSHGVDVDLTAGRARGQGRDRLLDIDYVDGSDGDDVIVTADDSYDDVNGRAGDDVIRTSDERDDVAGGPGDDTIVVGKGHDEAVGGPGNDRIVTGKGNDEAAGGPGDDKIMTGSGQDFLKEGGLGRNGPGLGNDYIDAGEGRDIVWFASPGAMSSEPASVDLAAGIASFGGEHTVLDVEDITLIQRGPVELYGNDGANRLYALTFASVTIDGRGGNDDISGSSGNDTLDGGDGTDTVTYDGSGAVVDLMAGTGTGPEGDVDQLSNFENIYGSCGGDSGDDQLFGDDGPNWIYGNCADDHIEGRGGDDILLGGDGDDSLDGGDGSDSLDGGAGSDTCVDGETVKHC